MIFTISRLFRINALIAGVLVGYVATYPALLAADMPATEQGVQGYGLTPAQPSSPSQNAATWHARESLYYKRNWGVDIVGVHPIASGYMLEFRYRILDADKAKTLNDEKAKAYLIDETTGTRFAVPNMENIGELRQKATPQGYRTYFIIFGNPGKLVKPGGRVTVVVGDFRADGLVVD